MTSPINFNLDLEFLLSEHHILISKFEEFLIKNFAIFSNINDMNNYNKLHKFEKTTDITSIISQNIKIDIDLLIRLYHIYHKYDHIYIIFYEENIKLIDLLDYLNPFEHVYDIVWYCRTKYKYLKLGDLDNFRFVNSNCMEDESKMIIDDMSPNSPVLYIPKLCKKLTIKNLNVECLIGSVKLLKIYNCANLVKYFKIPNKCHTLKIKNVPLVKLVGSVHFLKIIDCLVTQPIFNIPDNCTTLLMDNISVDILSGTAKQIYLHNWIYNNTINIPDGCRIFEIHNSMISNVTGFADIIKITDCNINVDDLDSKNKNIIIDGIYHEN